MHLRRSTRGTIQLFLHFWKEEEVSGREVWLIRWVRQQLLLALFEKVHHCCCCVRTGIVTMKKKATESRLWAALAPNFEDLRETMAHVRVGRECPSVLKRNGGGLARFSEQTGNYFPVSYTHLTLPTS